MKTFLVGLALMLLISSVCAKAIQSKSSGDSEKRSDGDVASLVTGIDHKINKVCYYFCKAQDENRSSSSCGAVCGYNPWQKKAQK